ncbi:MAG: hypothetical protein K0R61_5655 [Microvirga sp.]|nr:hypothetical protein [Microvirga sp.]
MWVGVSREVTQTQLFGAAPQRMARVVATAAVEELCDRDLGEPEGIVEFTVGDPAVESGPQRQLFGFARRVLHDHAPSGGVTVWRSGSQRWLCPGCSGTRVTPSTWSSKARAW